MKSWPCPRSLRGGAVKSRRLNMCVRILRSVWSFAYPTQRMEPVFGNEFKDEARADMLRRIEARPHAYVAREMVNLSQAPTLEPGA